MFKVRLLPAALLALALYVTSPTFAQKTLDLPFGPLGESGGSAVATITVIDDTVTLFVTASGLQPGTRYEVQTHAGNCEFPSASFGALGTLDTDEQGNASLTTTTARMSAAGVTIDLAILVDGLHTLDIRGPEALACVSIPAV